MFVFLFSPIGVRWCAALGVGLVTLGHFAVELMLEHQYHCARRERKSAAESEAERQSRQPAMSAPPI